MNNIRRLILIILFFSSIVWASNLDYLEKSNINQSETTYQFIERAKAEKREARSSFYMPESSNVRCAGRWPFGEADNIRPSDHFASDSIVFLSSGSGIRILKISNPALPRMIGQINCKGILSGWMGGGEGIVCKDSIVYALSQSDLWNGMQIFDIHNPTQPQELGNLAFSGWTRDIAVKDTLAYTVGYDSLFRVINISDPSNPNQVTSLMLPDYGLGITVQGNYAFVAAYHAGLGAIDISNPGNPQQLSSVGGFSGIHVVADGNLAYVAGGAGGLRIINIVNPDSIYEVGNLTSTPGADIWKIGMFVYMISTDSYNTDFWVIDVSDPSQPSRVSYATMSGWARAVWALSPFTYGYTASNWEGLYVIDLHDPVNPIVDTFLFKAYSSNDIVVQGDYAYIANSFSGLKIVNISNPVMPYDVGSYDTTGTLPECEAASVKDSFAYIPWTFGLSPFRSIDVSDPSNPRLAGVTGDTLFRVGDMIAKDSFVYVAAENRFQVFNVAHPRQPRLVGSCNLPTGSADLCLQGNFAYITPDLPLSTYLTPQILF